MLPSRETMVWIQLNEFTWGAWNTVGAEKNGGYFSYCEQNQLPKTSGQTQNVLKN